MIHFELLRDPGILIITPQGPLEKRTLSSSRKKLIHSLRQRESSRA
jgi:hypothetical protein